MPKSNGCCRGKAGLKFLDGKRSPSSRSMAGEDCEWLQTPSTAVTNSFNGKPKATASEGRSRITRMIRSRLRLAVKRRDRSREISDFICIGPNSHEFGYKVGPNSHEFGYKIKSREEVTPCCILLIDGLAML